MAQGSSNPTQDIKKINGVTIDSDAGNSGAGTQRVVIATNQSAVPISDNGQSLTVDGVVELGATSLAALENISVNINATDINIGNVDVVSLPPLSTGSNVIGSIANTSFQSTQSGTWTVQPGNIANTTPWLVRLNDGTNSVSIKAASTAATTTDASLVVALSPNTSLPTGTNAIGKLTANAGVIIGAIEIASAQTLSTVSTVTNLSQLGGQSIAMGSGVRSSGTQRVTIATDDVIQVSQFGTWNIGNVTTLPAITGTVTANIGSSGSLALDATLTAGNQKAIIRGGIKGATSAADVTSTSVDSNTQALDVSIKNSSIPVTGTFWQATQPVSGTVTANAGTGSFTVAQAAAANLNATVVGTGTFAVQAAQTGTWNINNVSGTISLPTGAATDSAVSAMSSKLPATLGQKTMANSMAVVMASDQSAVPVSGTVTANAGTGSFTVAQTTAANLNATVVGTGTFAVQASQSGTWNVNNVTGTVSLPTGASTETTLSGMSNKLPATLGQKAMANSLAVAIASDQGNVPVVSNNSEIRIQASFTRPTDTTTYTAGDLVSNSTTAGSVVPMSFTNAIRTAGDCVRIERVRIEKSGTSLTNASFRLHLFEASPTPTVGDNGVYNNAGVLATNNILNHAGTFPVTMTWSGSDGAMGIGVPTTGSGATISPTSGTTLFGLLEVTAAYTPASGEIFYVVLEGYRT